MCSNTAAEMSKTLSDTTISVPEFDAVLKNVFILTLGFFKTALVSSTPIKTLTSLSLLRSIVGARLLSLVLSILEVDAPLRLLLSTGLAVDLDKKEDMITVFELILIGVSG